MKARWVFASVAAGALALGLLAPGTAGAAPTAQKPSGQALVRIDGGTAYAKAKSKGQYRIVVPDGAKITWLGGVSGKKTRIGTFTPKALVAGWQRLGHRDGSKAETTLTWVEAGAKAPTFRAAGLSKPRINADGQLTFLAQVKGKLPTQMVDFAINVNRAGTASRDAYPIDSSPFYIDGTHYLLAVLVSAAVGHIEYYDASRSQCAPDTALPGPGIIVDIVKDVVCGTVTLTPTQPDGSTSYVQSVGSSDGSISQVNVAVGIIIAGVLMAFEFILTLPH
ncbi:MAG: hypothetical protein ACR2KE_04050 [Candidatus Nanopelagicales bacterium]